MKSRVLVCAILFGSVAGAFSAVNGQRREAATDSRGTQSAIEPAPTLKLLAPSGKFGMGRVGYEWIDASRPDINSTGPLARRSLMVYLWYPSSPKAAGKTGVYLPGARQMDSAPEIQPHVKEEFGDAWPSIVSGEFKSHAIESAPLAKSPKSFPVVLFSHGAGSSGFEYTSLIEDLVSHGYVVVAIEHPDTAFAVLFPDGKVVAHRQDPTPEGLTSEQRMQRMMAAAGLAITHGADDIVFVLNKLAELNHIGNPSFPLGGRLDLSRVAAMGHSAGGAFAARACQLDARIGACVSLDGALPPASAFPEFPDKKGFQQPVLLLEVDHSGDRMPFTPEQYMEFLKKKEAQLNLCPRGSYDILLKSAGLFHGSFSDYPLLAANGRATETEIALHNLRLTQSFARAFLDKYLKHERQPLLDDSKQYPEATVKQYGN
jgi:dienelactone hydrolase